MKTILIVDDQPDVRTLLSMILKKDDRDLLLAESGEEALVITRKTVPDLILLDVMMPGGKTGYEIARILKNEPETAACPIIVMTAKVQQSDRDEALAAGADDYISKPFNMSLLREKVETYLH